MIDGIVVVDSGQVIETTESAIIAKDEADRAEKWAKYSEEQANLASNNAIAAAASKEAAAQSAQSAANTVNGFDAHAAQKQQDFDDNAESKTNTYNSNASTLLQQYTDNAAQKLSAYNSNDATKTTAFNDNYTTKLNAFNSNATTKTNDFNSNASEKQAQVDASAETARKWAIGTISEQPQGSAKYWAEQAKTSTAGTLNESILTNCLTEIPQDIKVELSNGTLTLKAGSKVYVPNGVGKFDVVTIQKDVGGTRRSRGQEFLLSDENGAAAFWGKLYSGDSKPVDSGSYYVWYDTANNVIKATTDGGASWLSEKFSLPLGIYTADGTGITSIDQVFNGFGYIGNTIFALPGIKGRIPNGFNTDGSLNSIEITTNGVTTVTLSGTRSATYFGITSTNTLIYTNEILSGKAYYDKNVNKNHNLNSYLQAIFCGTFTCENGRITSLTPNTAFHAVDYSEFTRALKTKQDMISLTANRALVSDTSGNIAVSAVTSTELGYLDGVTSNIQTQFNNLPKHEVVSVLPVEPDANTFYYIPEE